MSELPSKGRGVGEKVIVDDEPKNTKTNIKQNKRNKNFAVTYINVRDHKPFTKSPFVAMRSNRVPVLKQINL